jgi:hypothetical protein
LRVEVVERLRVEIVERLRVEIVERLRVEIVEMATPIFQPAPSAIPLNILNPQPSTTSTLNYLNPQHS